MNNVEITKREISIAIIIFIILSAIGLFITNGIHDRSMVENDKYFKALKIDNDANMFNYALGTQIGGTLTFGKVSTVDPVEVDQLKGKHFSVTRETERYTKHTRQVSYKCGERTCHRTETYWTWDHIATDEYKSKTVKFMGGEYDAQHFRINEKYQSTVSAGFHLRYKFYSAPTKFKGVLYTHTRDGKLNDSKFFHNYNIAELMEKKEGEAEKNATIFLVIWEIISIGLAFAYTLLDNKFINGR